VERLSLDRPVTFLVGENGSGKSTLLEALALASRVPTVGSLGVERDDTLEAQRLLAEHLRLVWSSARTHRGFFLRAEDFFGWVRGQRRQRAELREEFAEQQERLADASEYGRMLAAGPFRRSLAEMESRYGEDPDARSHGESFLDLFRARFVPRGLHLLDEPEAALSPQSQLGLVALMKDMVDAGAQFLMATHSPILLAIPGATLLSFDTSPLEPVSYDELDSVHLYRDFLQEPRRYLRHLWSEEPSGG
jgi:predicted ATPase